MELLGHRGCVIQIAEMIILFYTPTTVQENARGFRFPAFILALL